MLAILDAGQVLFMFSFPRLLPLQSALVTLEVYVYFLLLNVGQCFSWQLCCTILSLCSPANADATRVWIAFEEVSSDTDFWVFYLVVGIVFLV